ncbi:MAG: APC family permease [Mycoplasmataceae bacterium]|nr:APC family permease [Mycoplasmataceae bacterium]
MNTVEGGIADAPLKKKISFFSAMFVVIGSSIGAGIFLKSKAVLDGSHGSLVLAIFTWLIAGFAVIAMALSLIEIASARNDNLSLIGWCKTFNSRFMYKASKNFMFYIYLPLTYFFMPLYFILQLQDGIGVWTHTTIGEDGLASLAPFSFGTSVDWLIWLLIVFAVMFYFVIVSGYSSRAGNIQNMGITLVKFIPLLVAALIGFVYISMNGNVGGAITPGFKPDSSNTNSLSAMTPGFGMFIAMAGIFFAYDGFYVTSGLQTEMEKPEKTPMAILFGLSIVTVIYLVIAISMSMNGSGDFYGFGNWLVESGQGWLFGVINILIAIGILGIINGFAMWAPRFVEDLIKEGELPFSSKFKNNLNPNRPKVGILYSIVIATPIVLIFTLMGVFGYIPGGYEGAGYGSGMESLYNFADLMANWAAIFTFGFIVMSIYGCLRNRKTKLIKTDEKKYFKPMAIFSIVVMSIALFITSFAPIFDLMAIFYLKDLSSDEIISRVMLVVVLILFILLTFLPTVIEDYISKKKTHHR